MSPLSRRDFVIRAAVTGAAIGISGYAPAQAVSAPATERSTATRGAAPVDLRWLDGSPPPLLPGTTWGVPWPRGTHAAETPFALRAGDVSVPVQSWPIARWPDGSLKWTAHAIAGDVPRAERITLLPGAEPATGAKTLILKDTAESIEIDTGVIRCRISRRGPTVIQSISRDGREIARDARLIALRQDQPEPPAEGALNQQRFASRIDKATVEQSGPVRAVVRIDGMHRAADSERVWLPFTLRLYLFAGGESVRIMHSFIFDGDEQTDFIRGLGLQFDVAMSDPLHDRHIRFAGEGDGLFAEGVRNLTGLRRDPGRPIIAAQLAGEQCPPVSDFPENVARRLELIPAWGDYTLAQNAADAFHIRKRTKTGHTWITAAHGRRAPGVGYIGGATGGGVAFGLRDFWQRHPTRLDIRNAHTDAAEVTLWLWSPDAPPMDLRPYHDGMGMDTYPKQIEGLEITYEDWEAGFDTPHGIARTSEMTLFVLPATPTREKTVDIAAAIAQPPMLACSPQQIHAAGVFGSWSLPDRSTPAQQRIEDVLDWHFDHYVREREQRRWYGFWDYGDVMHTYDRDRHTWRYDVGGYAWDNSELSPDLWLWYAFLRSGRADIFRFAEAMTRHTGEVDVYHLGKFAMLGSRHNVLHWGCSAKQLRISTAIYRRIYYFLTADERTGDLMRELIDADKTFVTLDPIRKIRTEPFTPRPEALGVGFGTDWGSLAAAWFTEWERTGDERLKRKLLAGMNSIAAMPHGFFTAGATYDLATGAFTAHGDETGVSHLSAVFGLPEICAELIQNFGDEAPGFEEAWLDYCTLYNAPREEQERAFGQALRGISLVSAHSRLTAYAAWKKKDPRLARRAWQEFTADDRRWAPLRYSMQTTRVEGPAVLSPVDEAPWVSTNDASQWSLAAIQNLALVPDALPAIDEAGG